MPWLVNRGNAVYLFAFPGYALDLNDNSKVLFEQESANIYRENLIDAQWAAILLNKLTASSTHSGSDEDTKQSLSRVSLIIKAIQETEVSLVCAEL